MRVCMVSPVAPPVQAANSLLPDILGRELEATGDETTFVSHRSPGETLPDDGPATVTFVPRRGAGPIHRSVIGAAVAGARIALASSGSIKRGDIVHAHSNGLVIEVADVLARYHRKPFVITLYGTDIWHHDPLRHARFHRLVQGAAHRVFYSRGLRARASKLGLAPEPSTVIHAPVAKTFCGVSDEERRALRSDLGVGGEPLLVAVKRLHTVAGYPDLLDALPAVVRRLARAQLWIIGEGGQRAELERRTANLGLTGSVRFLGRIDNAHLWRYYAAADLFVLASHLESWGSVMVESLACGTPIVASATSGAQEVQEHFPEAVTLFEIGDAGALASAVVRALARGARTGSGAASTIEERFRPAACAAQYRDVYRRALTPGADAPER